MNERDNSTFLIFLGCYVPMSSSEDSAWPVVNPQCVTSSSTEWPFGAVSAAPVLTERSSILSISAAPKPSDMIQT